MFVFLPFMFGESKGVMLFCTEQGSGSRTGFDLRDVSAGSPELRGILPAFLPLE